MMNSKNNNFTCQRTWCWFVSVVVVGMIAISSFDSGVEAFSTTTLSSNKKSTKIRTASVSLQETAAADAASTADAAGPISYATCGKCGSSYALTEADLGGGNGRYVLVFTRDIFYVIH